MYAWEEFKIFANYNDKVTVQVLGIDTKQGNPYIVKYKDKIFTANRSEIKMLKK